MARSRLEGLCRLIPPSSFMPRASRESPAVLKTVMPARTRYLRKVNCGSNSGLSGLRTSRTTSEAKASSDNATFIAAVNRCATQNHLSLGRFRGWGLILAVIFHPLVALRAQFEEGSSLFIQALAVVAVEHCF